MTGGTGHRHAAPPLRVPLRPSPDRTVNRRRLLAGAPSGLDRRGGRPPQAWTQLLGDDLDDLAAAAILTGPGPLLQPADHHHAVALREGLGGVLGLVAPHTTTVKKLGSLSRLRPDTATRNVARVMPPLVWRSSGSSVRLPAKLTLASVMVLPLSCCLAGRVCPALGPGARWTPWHAARPPGQAAEPTKPARLDQAAERARLRCQLGWWRACGWWSGMPAPPGQIPPPWARWEVEAPAARAGGGPSPGC
jgi:hypothetical protein